MKSVLISSNSQQILQQQLKPYCYYHKDNQIRYFCTNEGCTLPLCRQCYLIHRKQHYSHRICQFATLRQSAIRQLSAEKCNKIEIVDILEKQISQYKQFLMVCVNNAFQQILQKISLQQRKKQITEIDEKIDIIKSGSLRKLIVYLSESKTSQNCPEQIDFPSKKQEIINQLVSAFPIKNQRIITISDSVISKVRQEIETPHLISNQSSLSFKKESDFKQKSDRFSAAQSKCSTIKLINQSSKLSPKQSKQFKMYHHKSTSNLTKLKKPNSKGKGLSVCSSEKSLSFSHKENNQNNEDSIPVSKSISNFTEKSWRDVVNMKGKSKSTLKIFEKPKTALKIQTNKKSQDFLDNSQVLTPNQLRDLCLSKNINSRKKAESQKKIDYNDVIMKRYGIGEVPNKIKELIYI